MKYHFDATEDFLKRQNEIQILLDTADKEENSDKQQLFLKLAVVSLVTKFQVYIEGVLKEFVYQLKTNQIKYSSISVYMQLNSIKLKVQDNALINLSKHNKLNEDTREKINGYLRSINFIVDENQIVDDKFNFNTSFPLGRTGKGELLELFKQIKGTENIFINDITEQEIIDLNQLDSILLTRHLIIHQDRFNQTPPVIRGYMEYLIKTSMYCDKYLNNCLIEWGVILEERDVLDSPQQP